MDWEEREEEGNRVVELKEEAERKEDLSESLNGLKVIPMIVLLLISPRRLHLVQSIPSVSLSLSTWFEIRHTIESRISTIPTKVLHSPSLLHLHLMILLLYVS